MAKVVIFGIGDIARLAHVYFSTDSEHEVVAFAVDPEYKTSGEFRGLPLIDATQMAALYPPSEYSAFVSLGYSGMNSHRKAKYNLLKEQGYKLVSYVSSRATYLSEHPAGDNCFILEDNTIQPFVRIGNDVVLWSGNHIGHDAVIDDHCFITSHVVISGHTHIKESCFIGVNATLRNNITIGERTLIVAGATILKNTEPDSVYSGERATKLSKLSSEIKL